MKVAANRPNIFRTLNRQQIEKLERRLMAPAASKSRGAGNRIVPENPDPYRTAYYRDLGRIIHSVAFRNLAGKTQVFPFPKSPSVHTRAFHSMKVAQLGESIGSALGLNTTLIWAIGLGHDLGHSPFGHAGEVALNTIVQREMGDKYFFKHNVQSLRVVTELEKYFMEQKGLNLTLEVMDGILHHWGEGGEYHLVPRVEVTYQKYLKGSTITSDEIKQLLDPGKAKQMPLTYEGCVIRLSDRISYLPVDLEDALVHNFIREEKLPTPQRKLLNQVRKVLGVAPRDMYNTLITDTIEASRKEGQIAMSDKVGEAMNALQKFNYQNIYLGADRASVDEKIPFIFEKIFEHFTQIDGNSTQAAIDRIASLTDRQAITQFRQVTIPRAVL